ncbi:TPA: hypothetical protein ACFK6V_12575 [Neisseria gonorrhoeae]
MPPPRPSPTGEGVGFGRFFGCRRFERQLRFAAVVSGRLKNKKQPAQPVFLAANLNPNSLPVLSPRGRGPGKRLRIAKNRCTMDKRARIE